VGHTGEERKVYKVLTGKPEGKKPLTRPRCRWEHGIKMDLTEICWEGVDWIHLAPDRDQWWALMNAVMNLLASGTTTSQIPRHLFCHNLMLSLCFFSLKPFAQASKDIINGNPKVGATQNDK
jgi:hypothetical protein